MKIDINGFKVAALVLILLTGLGIIHEEFAKSSLLGAKFVLVLAGLTIVAVWT